MALSILFFDTTRAAPSSAIVCSNSASRFCLTPSCRAWMVSDLSSCSSALRSLSDASSIWAVACSSRVSRRETSALKDETLSFIVVFSSWSRADVATAPRSLSSAFASSASRSPPSRALCCSARATRSSISFMAVSLASLSCCSALSCAAVMAASSALCVAACVSFSCLWRDRSLSIREAARSSSWRCASISRSADSRSEFSWTTLRRSLRSSLSCLLSTKGAAEVAVSRPELEDGAFCFGGDGETRSCGSFATFVGSTTADPVDLSSVGASSVFSSLGASVEFPSEVSESSSTPIFWITGLLSDPLASSGCFKFGELSSSSDSFGSSGPSICRFGETPALLAPSSSTASSLSWWVMSISSQSFWTSTYSSSSSPSSPRLARMSSNSCASSCSNSATPSTSSPPAPLFRDAATSVWLRRCSSTVSSTWLSRFSSRAFTFLSHLDIVCASARGVNAN